MHDRFDFSTMSLPAAMGLSVSLSGMTHDEIASAVGWSSANGNRILNPSDDYWPTLPNLPRFCRAVGNTILIEWAEAQVTALPESVRPLDSVTLIKSMGDMFREMGELAKAGADAADDGNLEPGEAAKLIRELKDVLRVGSGMLSGLYAVRNERI